jgi:hypothetical protein
MQAEAKAPSPTPNPPGVNGKLLAIIAYTPAIPYSSDLSPPNRTAAAMIAMLPTMTRTTTKM